MRLARWSLALLAWTLPSIVCATNNASGPGDYRWQDEEREKEGLREEISTLARPPKPVVTASYATVDKRQNGGFPIQPTFASVSQAVSTLIPCATATLTPPYPPPVTAPGFQSQLIIQGLYRPRSIVMDQQGHMLVLQSGAGITSLTLQDGGGTCLGLLRNITLLIDNTLTHGLALSTDNQRLYASSAGTVWVWNYNPSTQQLLNRRQVVTGMDNQNLGFGMRSLSISKFHPEALIVSRGADTNLDLTSTDVSSGHGQVRYFDTRSSGNGMDFATQGTLLGWGLRNPLGVAESPIYGGVFSTDIGIDGITRNGADVSNNNPGDELNFHGYLNDNSKYYQGGNYGYPECSAVFDPTTLRGNGAGGTSLQVGQQFANDYSGMRTDAYCAANFVPPRLTFQAHSTPIDIKFYPSGRWAFVTFHGSVGRTSPVPVGYKVSAIPFVNGYPQPDPQYQNAFADILVNSKMNLCPDQCVTPTGLYIDGIGRIFMSSDTTGEIYVLINNTIGAINVATQASASGIKPWAYELLFIFLSGVIGVATLI